MVIGGVYFGVLTSLSSHDHMKRDHDKFSDIIVFHAVRNFTSMIHTVHDSVTIMNRNRHVGLQE